VKVDDGHIIVCRRKRKGVVTFWVVCSQQGDFLRFLAHWRFFETGVQASSGLIGRAR
jgi:hypothetical protein